MGDGRKMRAPCGHQGEVVIGTYVQCKQCDVGTRTVAATPAPIPLPSPMCPGCGSDNIEYFADDIDAVMWFISNYQIPSGSPMPPSAGEWGCNRCVKVFPRPT